MSRHSREIVRSNCYMMNKKSELITLMEQVGTATLWLTFRLPNHLWEDFEILFSNKPKTILLLILKKITNFILKDAKKFLSKIMPTTLIL